MNKKIITSLISIAVAAILVFVFAKPFWSSITLLHSEIVQREQEVVQLKELLIKTRQLEQDYQGIQSKARRAALVVPDEKDLPHLLVQFESLASNSGLLLESVNFSRPQVIEKPIGYFSPESEQSASGLSSLSVAVNLSGSYEAFKNYLASLEENIRVMDVYSIRLGALQGLEESFSTRSGIFGFNLGINVYYQQ